jgi:hypothetical protein
MHDCHLLSSSSCFSCLGSDTLYQVYLAWKAVLPCSGTLTPHTRLSFNMHTFFQTARKLSLGLWFLLVGLWFPTLGHSPMQALHLFSGSDTLLDCPIQLGYPPHTAWTLTPHVGKPSYVNTVLSILSHCGCFLQFVEVHSDSRIKLSIRKRRWSLISWSLSYLFLSVIPNSIAFDLLLAFIIRLWLTTN